MIKDKSKLKEVDELIEKGKEYLKVTIGLGRW
jgi:hypothetical protein